MKMRRSARLAKKQAKLANEICEKTKAKKCRSDDKNCETAEEEELSTVKTKKMRRSARLAEKREKLGNETQMELKKSQSGNEISKIARLDDGTMVEVFKYLNYCQLAKNSLASKRFWDLICTHRHSLALLYVCTISMRYYLDYPTYISVFNKQLSPEEYNEWVISNNYSKQILPAAGKQSSDYVRRAYRFSAEADCRDSNLQPNVKITAFSAQTKLNYENSTTPLFQHFVRLIMDPFIYIRYVELTAQNDVLNLLAKAIDSDRLKCEELTFYPELNSQEFVSWIKSRVLCNKFRICVYNCSNYDEELLDLFMTGAHCTSEINVYNYDSSSVIFDFVQKFMGFKMFDESQIVQSIKSCVPDRARVMINHNYARFIVGEVKNELGATSVFEFVNNDVGKKMLIISCTNNASKTCFLLKFKNI